MKNLLTFAVFLVTITVFAQQEDVEINVAEESGRLAFIGVNTTYLTQTISFTLSDVEGLEGDLEPIKLDIQPYEEVTLKEFSIVDTYQYTYRSAVVASDLEGIDEWTTHVVTDGAQVVAYEKDEHYLYDFGKVNEGIVVFDKTNCSRCSYVTNYLLENDIDFKVVNISESRENNKFLWEILREDGYVGSTVTTPVVLVNGKVSYNHANLKRYVRTLK